MLHLRVLIAVFSTLLLLHASFRLYRIIAAERPEWIPVGQPSARFYAGIPRILLAIVQFQVLKVAFSSRARQLTTHSAARHVRHMRLALPLGAAAFYMAVFASS